MRWSWPLLLLLLWSNFYVVCPPSRRSARGACCADVACCRGALDVADELLDGHAEQTLYYGGSPRLTLQLGAALQGAVESRETGLHICEWVDRWRDAGAPPPMPPQLDIISLEDEHRDFRAALGVSVRPRGLADWSE